MTTRRTFLTTSAALAATAISYDRIYGANETLNIGLHRHRRPLPAPA